MSKSRAIRNTGLESCNLDDFDYVVNHCYSGDVSKMSTPELMALNRSAACRHSDSRKKLIKNELDKRPHMKSKNETKLERQEKAKRQKHR